MERGEKNQTSARAQNIILEDRKRLNVSGVEEVVSFDDAVVVMETDLGELVVRGAELRVEQLSVDTGDLCVEGRIAELCYLEKRTKAGLWERLFG